MKMFLSSLLLVATLMPQQIYGFSVVTTSKKIINNNAGTTALFSAADTKSTEQPGTAVLDKPWEELGFEFRNTKSHLRMTFKDGEWGAPELVKEPYVNIHIGATALHYGQACFEGMKAFCHEDNSVHLFRPDENAKRLRSSCERIMMPYPTEEEFTEACNTVVRDNVAYVPPYGSGGALYLRPLLFGSGSRIGVQPADEYTFLIMVIPVGDYYKGGLSSPVDGMIIRDFDRAAPRGVGNVKVAGNYAADLLPNQQSKKKGYPIGLYLDAASQTKVEEFSTSNFVGIDNESKKYVTPYAQRSVLPSITNKSLMTLAREELGYEVEQRDIPLTELTTFDEVVACGTAVVVTPVGSLTDVDSEGEEIKYDFGTDEVGATTRQLFDLVRAIQFGDAEDKNGW
eukprot:CAMPEP_0197831596 /NCGR_PEP_ID=MMETSP1437-20131217/11126_1 /TAXON_ID=49252 ORGANISM="Eucampia antarctica, Strain CCMP1452" /NCGR_SAMPLE_ID=MMETSP1437 /ASSEMBLY_ACC=CAM_ASM_001096 /LENGTH=397 /DNA_ID=CAMNT_0043434587 /DNA_START=84 /DNA_END=1274 /DNA_ORIENTATION=+